MTWLRRRMKEVVEGEALLHRCQADIDMHEDDHPMYPATVNDHKLHEHAEKVLKLLVGPENVKPGDKIMAGEDFSFYQQKIPVFAALAEMYIQDHQNQTKYGQ
ncbi:IAA-amino acid hydrolase ILR1-like 3 isoform X2 [Raphanus sativus]|uniref:IAA-amino acid hydrolase ILR1-like 3 isoform X2 n=1 Tax=Raphanus sativus TaxID=3726 RepID=A0A9W3CL30_RAPSA|nr:IAA-amino acid hydrolase ILR1-like 3 isoform X2 [Raphanus sativus]